MFARPRLVTNEPSASWRAGADAQLFDREHQMQRTGVKFLFSITLAVIAACNDDPVSPTPVPHEVWLVDQSNSPGLTFGGKIYIYDDTALATGGTSMPSTVIDLAQATATLCLSSTGANPVRPHMLFFTAFRTHAILAFVASGHVVVFDAASRAPIACLRTTAGAGGARQAHAAMPSEDGSFILVANQNGKLLERIDANYGTNTFTLNAAATLNLATCTTPNGAPCESTTSRPDNAPICPVIASISTLAFITLRGGGLFVVNPKATPMAILGEYDRATVHGNGCGGVELGASMYINSGGATASNLSEFDVYRFPRFDGSYAASNPPNTPAPTILFSDDAGDRDSHGMTTLSGRYLWVVDRVGNLIEIFEPLEGTRVATLNLAGATSVDPSPDLLDKSPNGDVVYVSLRGPSPLTGDPHSSTGTTPGLGVVQVTQGGRSGTFTHVVRISNVDATGVERADAHAIAVRRK
jgi:hypothetical protein